MGFSFEDYIQYEQEEQFKKEIVPQLKEFDSLAAGVYCLEVYKIYKVNKETEEVNKETEEVDKVTEEVYMPRPHKVYTFAKVKIEDYLYFTSLTEKYTFYNLIGVYSKGKYCWVYPNFRRVTEDSYMNGYKYIWFLYKKKIWEGSKEGSIYNGQNFDEVRLKEIIIYYNIK